MSMSDPRLSVTRAARNHARVELLRNLGIAKVDLSPRVLQRRVTAEAQRKALMVVHQAVDIASDNRGVVTGTLAALVLWLARKPIFGGARSVVARYRLRKTIAGRTQLMIAGYWRKLKEYADD